MLGASKNHLSLAVTAIEDCVHLSSYRHPSPSLPTMLTDLLFDRFVSRRRRSKPKVANESSPDPNAMRMGELGFRRVGLRSIFSIRA